MSDVGCCGIGALSKLAIGLHGSTPTRMDFIDFVSKNVKSLVDGSEKAIRGTLDPIDTNVAEGVLFVQGRIRMWMTPQKNDILLPCFGFTESPTDTFTLGDSLPACKLIVGPSGSNEITYDNCLVTDWTMMGQKGSDPILLDIGWMGTTREPATAGTFFVSQTNPSMVEGYALPYPDGSASITRFNYLNIDRYFPMFRLSMDYGVIREFNQSVNATKLCPTKHELTFSTNALYSTCDSTTDLLETPMTGDVSGDDLVIDLQRVVGSATYRTIVTVANAKLIASDPSIRKNDWVRLPINIRGYATGATPLLSILNDAT